MKLNLCFPDFVPNCGPGRSPLDASRQGIESAGVFASAASLAVSFVSKFILWNHVKSYKVYSSKTGFAIMHQRCEVHTNYCIVLVWDFVFVTITSQTDFLVFYPFPGAGTTPIGVDSKIPNILLYLCVRNSDVVFH